MLIVSSIEQFSFQNTPESLTSFQPKILSSLQQNFTTLTLIAVQRSTNERFSCQLYNLERIAQTILKSALN